ncbi:MAG: hypothetical protein ABR520_10755 [Mycobacteriales bacterium]
MTAKRLVSRLKALDEGVMRHRIARPLLGGARAPRAARHDDGAPRPIAPSPEAARDACLAIARAEISRRMTALRRLRRFSSALITRTLYDAAVDWRVAERSAERSAGPRDDENFVLWNCVLATIDDYPDVELAQFADRGVLPRGFWWRVEKRLRRAK